MKRTWAAAAAAVALLVYWAARNSEWVDVRIPIPPHGEARTNPFYAAQHFAEQLHVRAVRDVLFTPPPPGAVVVMSVWNWDLSVARRDALERWVESGGRLVVDQTLIGDLQEFERWSHVVRERRRIDKRHDDAEVDERCAPFTEERQASNPPSPAPSYRICDADPTSSLVSGRTAEWMLRGRDSRVQAMRMAVGRGSVTVINAEPFRDSSLFDGDHAALFVAAAQLRAGEEVHFLSEENHPSLLALVWIRGAPLVVLGAALIGLALWRQGVRFGPLARPEPSGRRSLAEQILGSGRFVMRHGGGDALHAACVRALDEAAQRRINGYGRLPAAGRAASVARLTGVDEPALASAMETPGSGRQDDVPRTIAVLETARRRLYIDRRRESHGTRSCE